MQTGFILEGSKSKILSDASVIISKEKARYKKNCDENQVFDGFEADGITARHKAAKLPYASQAKLLDAALEAIKEEIAHCKSDDAIEVMFNLTVHRPNPE